MEGAGLLFVGDDWAEDHHDVELLDDTGRRVARARLPEGMAGMTRLHAMIGEHLDEDAKDAEVVVGIETDRGLWVQALLAAGYQVYALNPLQVARFRERHAVSGAKSDAADAYVLADIVRTDRHRLRPISGDSCQAEAVKVVTRTHKTLVWERTRHMLRLRHLLRDFFPAALSAFDDLADPGALAVLRAAPDPTTAAALSINDVTQLLKAAGRRGVATRAEKTTAALGTEQLGQPTVIAAAYAVSVRAQVAVLTTLNTEIKAMEEAVEKQFSKHPHADIYLSQPGLGQVLGARILAEFGDDTTRYSNARARKNYAGTSPITRQSGRRTHVLARYVHNDRLVDAIGLQAFSALRASPGARAYYDRLRARGIGHRAALRQLGNRLVGILHGCLKTSRPYNESMAWPPQQDAGGA
jgi:transposase